MKVIDIHHPYRKNQIPSDDVVLALGFFDGVHRGHQEVIRIAREEANKKGLKLALMTFNHHPSVVFQKVDVSQIKYLTTVEQKAKLMAKLGVDYLYVVEFTSSFASLSPQDFVDQYIVGLNAKIAVAGFDYTYGKADVANMQTLPNYAKGRFEVVTVSEKKEADLKISSTNVRQMMADGQMEDVNHFLGYPYEIDGIVVHGDKRGRLLGYPTANIKPTFQSLIPKVGVYAVKIKVANQWYNGMAQIGHNITFEKDRPMTIEVNILDFNQDIYGEHVAVQWNHFLRPEMKFSGMDGLIKQLQMDEEHTRTYFN
ncbi:riboflavin biosynthesis protein RibF [Vagococcus penaei]|uniref:Riboflavin biosynthesis protein n=1 Tax=Vagococcus penaei TaxID=633807 RepID=A0A1Q2D3R5_9ENTE|nr:riboflavin biosynthesis protein RibF [Vagococcus penaei]AQP53034.1 riboflavin biosynthesis protein RibF [Vagococcus penaei]RSU06103.1 riboflavin biosynthesis protein RibF [Vagococcus penaei]